MLFRLSSPRTLLLFASIGRCSRRHFSQGCRALCEAKQQHNQQHKNADTAQDQFDFQENVQADRDAQSDHRERLKEEDDEATFAARQKILHTSLGFVHKHGWTQKTLAAGAEAEGLPAVAHGMFPRGGVELAEFFYSSSNEELANRLVADVEEAQKDESKKKRVSIFVRDAVELRLRMLTPYVDTWPQAMALMTLPQNAGKALKNLGTLVDHIWYHAGDRSLDMNWYTKRVTLAGIYKGTELYMLQDQSEDFEDTWDFLDRRLDDMARVGKCVKKLQQSGGISGDLVLGGLSLARNILGINSRNR